MSTQSKQGSEIADFGQGGFGPNEWLVEEMYEQYLSDPSSVDAAWHEFFADYKPSEAQTNGVASTPTAAATTRPRPASNGARPAPATPAPRPPARPTEPSPPPGGTAAGAAPAPAPAPAAPETGTAPAAPAGRAAPQRPQATPVRPTLPGRPQPLRGAAARTVTNMEASLSIPTATSVRAVPAKLMSDNRVVINNHLRRARGGKVSFTHLIGFAVVKALVAHPEMNNSYALVDGRPTLVVPDHVNLGLAIDLQRSDGSRSLVVASIKNAETMDFLQFWQAYEEIIRRARTGKLGVEDFAGTTISLTNPGTIGTVHSVPRLMQSQGCIVGVGAMEYPAEFQGMSAEALAESAISPVIMVTSTYDHRIIQGAQSGEFLRRMHELLLDDGFYDEVFRSLQVPYQPIRWMRDQRVSHEGQIDKAARVIELINAYRTNGHLMADTDPLEFRLRGHDDLDITKHSLTLWDLDREFPVGGFAGMRTMKLRDVLGVLRDAYCRRVGVEYMHINDPEERSWLQERVEVHHEDPEREEQKHILGRLNAAEAFETFLQTKYVGQRRFSLEGSESVIPLLDAVMRHAAAQDLDEVVIGMAHRGRLNVLANIVGKSYAKIFREFEGYIDPGTVHGSGDVKYHLGATGTFTSPLDGRKIAVALTSNPSHLEAVNPVLEGIVRAKQDMINKGQSGFTVLPVLLHGDAAFAGQGVVAETLNLSQLRGYRTGGTVHVIINNQVGFTTSPNEARSSLYCTDVARMIQAPIFHVNGDDPEACVRVAKLAVAYRQAFKKDVVVDMVCYRRRGHNETDNPSFTQPKMYGIIDAKRSVRKLYTEALIGRGDITMAEAEEALRDYQGQLEKVFLETRNATGQSRSEPEMSDAPSERVATAVSRETVKRIGDAYVNLPDGFAVHPRLKPQLERRAAMASEGGIDWGFGELLAFGSLVLDGRPVRLAGQDSRRGTFVQRHAMLVDKDSGEEYTPLKYLDPGQAPFWVYDSLLSEYAAMGFEYGYSVAHPDALVMWEAQFGDFANGAQSIIDEFISSGEAKWGQRSAVTLLLPHGYEGQGPDHSSARIERFLQLCADGNMTVALPSTPANYFHLLRHHALSSRRRPMVVFTPKSLLRLRAATSSVEEFTSGGLQTVIPDSGVRDPQAVTRVLMCAGKVYYDLAAYREAQGITDTAIVRLEQFYPLDGERMSAVLAGYPNARDLRWVQEEPENMGAWAFVALHLPAHLGGRPLVLASRPASASPAAGSGKIHDEQQKTLVSNAFTG